MDCPLKSRKGGQHFIQRKERKQKILLVFHESLNRRLHVMTFFEQMLNKYTYLSLSLSSIEEAEMWFAFQEWTLVAAG